MCKGSVGDKPPSLNQGQSLENPDTDAKRWAKDAATGPRPTLEGSRA